MSRTWPLFLCVLHLLGCGTRPPQEPLIARADLELQEVRELYRMYANEKGRPPTRLSDLQAYEAGFPYGYQALQRGLCVVRWGMPLTGAPTAILAHEKDAAQKGGWVLLRDGTVQQMTAPEVQAALKAPK
jgi:hypothetical protein